MYKNIYVEVSKANKWIMTTNFNIFQVREWKFNDFFVKKKKLYKYIFCSVIN